MKTSSNPLLSNDEIEGHYLSMNRFLSRNHVAGVAAVLRSMGVGRDRTVQILHVSAITNSTQR